MRRHRRRTVRIQIDYLSEEGPCRGSATTLGAGGLFIATVQTLPRGCALRMCFRLPGSELRHEISGRVVWSNPRGASPHTPGMGIAFTDRQAQMILARELERMD